MAIDGITLIINGRNFSGRLSTYSVQKEVSYAKVIKNLSGDELAFGRKDIPVLSFSLFPANSATSYADKRALSSILLSVTYTDPDMNDEVTENMRVSSNLDKAFLLNSVDGNIYYKGGVVILRKTVRGD